MSKTLTEFVDTLQNMFEVIQDVQLEQDGPETDVNEFDIDDLEMDKIKRVSNFEDIGLLTRNKGLVLKLENGDEYHLTIVKAN